MKTFLMNLLITFLLISGNVSAQLTKIDSSKKVIEPPNSGLVAIPLPQLDRMDKPVIKQIESFQKSLIDLISKGDILDASLADGYGRLGQLYHAYDIIESAESCYLNASRLVPEDYRWIYLLGVLYQKSGQLTKSVDYYKIVRKIQPNYVAAASNLGNVYLQLNLLEEANNEFQAALKLAPDFPSAFYGLGMVALLKHKYSEAVKQFHAALEKVPAANRIHYSLGMAYRGLGDLQNAQTHLNQQGPVGVRPIDPLVDALQELIQGERVHLIKGRMALSAGRYKEAVIAFTEAVKAKPKSVRGHVNLGVALARIGDIEGAIEQFRTVLQYDTKNQNARFNLGLQLSQKKEYFEAIDQFQSVLKANPKDLETIRELVKAFVIIGREGKALDLLHKAKEFAPDDEPILLSLSKLLIKHGRYREARDLLDHANRRFPDRGLTAHDLARLLAVCPDTSLRNGRRSVDLAVRIYQAQKTSTHAETLALALAETGRCEEAASLQKQLITIVEQTNNIELANRFRNDLVLYEKGKPCRPAIQVVK